MSQGKQSKPRDYREGQVWEYRTRPGDEGSQLKIQKIEPFPGLGEEGMVFHISIAGVCLKKPGLQPLISHAPVSQESLDASVSHLSEGGMDFPSADDGITAWRNDRGGVFTIPVADVVAYIDDVSAS